MNQLFDIESQKIANYICSNPKIIVPIYYELCKDIIPKITRYKENNIELKIIGRRFMIQLKDSKLNFISFSIPEGIENSPLFNEPDILINKWSIEKNKKPICYNGLLHSDKFRAVFKHTLINKNWIEEYVLSELNKK